MEADRNDLREDIARGITKLLYDWGGSVEERYFVYREVLYFLHEFQLVSCRAIYELAKKIEFPYLNDGTPVNRKNVYYAIMSIIGTKETAFSGMWQKGLGTLGHCISNWVVNALCNGITLGNWNRSWSSSLCLEVCAFAMYCGWISEDMFNQYRVSVAAKYSNGDLNDRESITKVVFEVFGESGSKIDEWMESVGLPEKSAFAASLCK